MGTDRCVAFRQLSAIIFDYDLESMMKKYVEIGIGNRWIVRTEIEHEDGTESEYRGYISEFGYGEQFLLSAAMRDLNEQESIDVRLSFCLESQEVDLRNIIQKRRLYRQSLVGRTRQNNSTSS